jgi:hypothetical protein
MQVLILEDDPAFQAQLAQMMMGHGFNVLCVDTVPGAEAFLRLGMVDVLIAGERIGGKLSHAVALLAECRNPLLAAVLRTDRKGPDLDELFDLVPSLVGILGRGVDPALVTQVVLAATAGVRTDSATSHLAARWAAAERPADSASDSASDPASDSADDPADDLMVDSLGDALPPVIAATPAVPAPAALAEHAVTARSWDGLWPADLATGAVASSPVDAVPLPQDPAADPADQADRDPVPAAVFAQSSLDLASLPALHPAREVVAVTVPDVAPAVVQPVSSSVTPAIAPPVTPARSLRPSPDSPLARVMAAGGRALGRPAQGLAGSDILAALRPRATTLPGWFAGASSESRPAAPRPAAPRATAPRADAAQPAQPAPAPSPSPLSRSLPTLLPERRLHLN